MISSVKPSEVIPHQLNIVAALNVLLSQGDGDPFGNPVCGFAAFYYAYFLKQRLSLKHQHGISLIVGLNYLGMFVGIGKYRIRQPLFQKSHKL